jgi:hypothetical protein
VPVFSVLDLDVAKVRVTIPEGEIGKIHVGSHSACWINNDEKTQPVKSGALQKTGETVVLPAHRAVLPIQNFDSTAVWTGQRARYSEQDQ